MIKSRRITQTDVQSAHSFVQVAKGVTIASQRHPWALQQEFTTPQKTENL